MNTTILQNQPGEIKNWTNLYLEPKDFTRYLNIALMSDVSMEFLSLSRRRSSLQNVASGKEQGQMPVIAA